MSPHQDCLTLRGDLLSASGEAAKSPQGLTFTPEQHFQEPSKGHSGPTHYAQLQTPGQQVSRWVILSPCSIGLGLHNSQKGASPHQVPTMLNPFLPPTLALEKKGSTGEWPWGEGKAEQVKSVCLEDAS